MASMRKCARIAEFVIARNVQLFPIVNTDVVDDSVQ